MELIGKMPLLLLLEVVEVLLDSKGKYELSWWLSGKESTCQYRRLGFNPWIGKIPWRRKWQSHSIIITWEIPWTEDLAGYSPWGCKGVRHN